MTQPESVRRQIEEAQRIHQAVYSPPEESDQGEQQEEVQQAPDSSGQVHDWKLRFTNYKANADREIANLRNGMGQLQAQLQAAVKQLEEVKQAKDRENSRVLPPELLSEDEREMLGEENLAIVAKVADAKAQAKVTAMEGTIKRLEEQLAFYAGREQQRDQRAAVKTLEEKMTEAYDGWKKVDNDPAFAAWMSEVDPLTGKPRDYLFKAAQRSGDVERMADFYRKYGEGKGARDPRQNLLTPAGRPGVNEPQGGRVWSQRDVAEFYAKIRRGEFRGREAERQALEADLFAAQREGRVR